MSREVSIKVHMLPCSKSKLYAVFVGYMLSCGWVFVLLVCSPIAAFGNEMHTGVEPITLENIVFAFACLTGLLMILVMAAVRGIAAFYS